MTDSVRYDNRHGPESPVFIGGIAGTGKTQLRVLLNRHPNLVITRRTYMWRNFYARYGPLGVPENFERCLAAMLATSGIAALDPDPDRIRSEFLGGPPTYGALFALFHRHHAERVGKPRWGDQLGLSEARADAILGSYPLGRMIHMVRDPRSPTFSAQPPGRLGWIIGKWITSLELAERNSRAYPDRYLVVRYEDLCDAPHDTLRRVGDFIGESLDVSVPLDHGSSREESARHGIAAQGPSVRFVEDRAGHLMPRHGYLIGSETEAGLRYHLVDRPVNTMAMAAWRLKLTTTAQREAE